VTQRRCISNCSAQRLRATPRSSCSARANRGSGKPSAHRPSIPTVHPTPWIAGRNALWALSRRTGKETPCSHPTDRPTRHSSPGRSHLDAYGSLRSGFSCMTGRGSGCPSEAPCAYHGFWISVAAPIPAQTAQNSPAGLRVRSMRSQPIATTSTPAAAIWIPRPVRIAGPAAARRGVLARSARLTVEMNGNPVST